MIPSLRIKQVALKDYIDIVRKRGWIVLIALILATCYGIFSFLVSPDIYRAKATITSGQHIFLRSRTLAERVVKSLNLSESPEQLLGRMKVISQKGNVVDIIATGNGPAKTANVANMWAREYIELITKEKSSVFKRNADNLEKQLGDVSRSTLDAEMILTEFTKKYPQVAKGEGRIGTLEKQISQVEKDIQALSTKYSMDHPRMSFLNSQLETLKKQLTQERDKLSPFQEQAAQYRELQRRIEIQKDIYNDLLGRIRKVQAYARAVRPDIRIVDKAPVPQKPLSKKGKIPRAALIGLLFSVFICFVMEYMDTTLKKAEEVEFYAKMPFLGYIPSMGNIFKNRKKMYLFAHLKPDSQVAESFRNVKVALIFASPEEKFMQAIGVTSSVPKEGKSFVASNLAISFARAKEKTLLIDGDMRQCSLMESFSENPERGLGDILDGKAGLDEAVVSTQISNLSFLSAGNCPTDPTDLLSQQKFNDLFEEIKKKFQRIVIDIPSMLSFNDIFFWGSKCDGIIDVVGAGTTPLKDITAATRKLEGKANIIGGVLNNISVEKDFEYYRHYFQSFLEKEFKHDKSNKEEDKNIQGGQ